MMLVCMATMVRFGAVATAARAALQPHCGHLAACKRPICAPLAAFDTWPLHWSGAGRPAN